MDLKDTILKGIYYFFSCPQGPNENSFERVLVVRMDLTNFQYMFDVFLVVRMDLTKIFLKGFRRRAKKI